MRRSVSVLLSVLALVSVTLFGPGVAGAATQPGGDLVAASPRSGTPHVLDGRVYSIAQVGDQIILGGTFTLARNDGTQTQITRNRLLAFNANTGLISTTFNPNPNNDVEVVIPAGDGQSVYVGGSFTNIGGVTRSRVARVQVSNGAVTAFNAGTISAKVNDLRLQDGWLWLGGRFSTVKGVVSPALASINVQTGTVGSVPTIAGTHNGGNTTVAKFDISGNRLVAVGNFTTVGNQSSRQIAMLNLSGGTASLATWRTTFYSATCANAFDSYMRDIDFAPDGTFFVVNTTGAYRGASSPCDTTARFEANGGAGSAPSWIDSTGGDTLYGVEVVSPSVVYVGGHQRWHNNPFVGDSIGPGAVARSGIAALDTLSGLPYSWNPGRTRGVGLFDFLLTDAGLWVGSDTTVIGGVTRSRIALMPTAATGGFPAVSTPTLPGDLYVAGSLTGTTATNSLTGRSFNGTTAGSSTNVSAVPRTVAGVPQSWVDLRGAFMLNNTLYTAWGNGQGSFTKQSFDGTSFGSATAVATSDQLMRLSDWYDDIANATSMFYDKGRIYFTRAGSSQLYYRYFNPQSDVVGALRYSAASASVFASTRGAFVADNELYVATSSSLMRMGWNRADGALAGSPTGTPVTVLAGNGWDARALFLTN